MYYFDIQYFDFYNDTQKQYAQDSLWTRTTRFSVFLSKCILYLTPTALLLMFQFYKNQQNFLKLNEQKKVAELTALKNQLNPHFLFNTLNNLYALALDKSDKTPEVIERLSDILDYMLYRCDDTYVPIHKEIQLIENYLSLEKVRYGKRAFITFDHHIDQEVTIAPLILLTFVENAFKHGVSQELKQCTIIISMTLKDSYIVFSIFNSKPKNGVGNQQKKDASLGIKNVKQQLELLYSNAYDLQVLENEDSFEVMLKLRYA
ncbi:hypothetical protein GCM10022393_14580 [Aquimarina addita]|uniref:Signal transduction histidine kinase internal region domain-containing protein n=2 Tax=Aquimarina addita TaxID=870485 RepID=A0ABP7XG74_9FLAO